MSQLLLISIIINNYNYGRYLRHAIDSALHQTYPSIEVIVVDDGSTDDSRNVIASYGTQLFPIFQKNGGQISAFNAGFAACRGHVVLFLDADDTLYPTAAERADRLLRETRAVKVHWPLQEVDGDGVETGRSWPGSLLPAGDLRQAVLRGGPDSLLWPPTSGNAWATHFLDQIFPLPNIDGNLKRSMAGAEATDAYLSVLAPLFGTVAAIHEPQGTYRIHGQNSYATLDFDRKLRRDMLVSDFLFTTLQRQCALMCIDVDPERWKQASWFHRLHASVQEIHERIPVAATLLLVDEDSWGCNATNGRRTLPFLEKNGCYWGPPADDASAIHELERQRQAGASFMLFAWPAFWWLDYYHGLGMHLRNRYPCVLKNERILLFNLHPERRAEECAP